MAHATGGHSYAGKTALVVDDDPDFLDQMTQLVSALGFKVVTANGQADAEKLMTEVTPDLAVLDLLMETMDAGFVLSYQLKKRWPTLPIMIVTAVTAETGFEFDVKTREERSWIKADAYLRKPVRAEQLRQTIDRLMAGR